MQGCFGGEKGEAGEPHACAHRPEAKRARNNMNKVNTGKLIRVKKWPKTVKSQNNINIAKKTRKREKKDRTRSTARGQNSCKPKDNKEAERKSKKLCATGTVVSQKTCNNKQCKIRNGEMGEKKLSKQTNDPNKQRKQGFIYIPLKQVAQASKTSKQPWHTATFSMCIFCSRKCNKIKTKLMLF